jgi:catechol 2,3-dioxygenase-like lactoylglutathione lyase family enzyme
MQQQISVITLGVADLARSRRFYAEGFGWAPVFENDDIIFFQMNGLMLGLWKAASQSDDMGRPNAFGLVPMSLAHNVGAKAEVKPLMDRLASAGGRILKEPVVPPPGGFAGYVTDPDGHAWEIAFNPAWTIDAEGRVTFGV